MMQFPSVTASYGPHPSGNENMMGFNVGTAFFRRGARRAPFPFCADHHRRAHAVRPYSGPAGDVPVPLLMGAGTAGVW